VGGDVCDPGGVDPLGVGEGDVAEAMKSNEMAARLTLIKDELGKIERRYNGDFDLIPGGPSVTWAEYELKVQVNRLADVVSAMLEKMTEMDQQLALCVRARHYE